MTGKLYRAAVVAVLSGTTLAAIPPAKALRAKAEGGSYGDARAGSEDPAYKTVDGPAYTAVIAGYRAALKKSGITILLIEQNVEIALRIADRAYILDQGEIVFTGTAQAMLADAAIQDRYCAV